MQATPTDRRPTPQTDRAAESAQPAGGPQACAADTDWLELLALGLRLDTVLPAASQGGWRRTPVLLSY